MLLVVKAQIVESAKEIGKENLDEKVKNSIFNVARRKLDKSC